MKQVLFVLSILCTLSLGPTTPVSLGPGETQFVSMLAAGQSFETWSAHAEVG